MAKKQAYHELLARLAEEEYNDMFLYFKEAGLFKKKLHKGQRIADLFNRFAAVELRHADILTAKLIALGGTPHASLKFLETATSLHSVLERHRVRERTAHDEYARLLDMTDDEAFRISLKGIRENEREHLETITHILDRLGR